MPAKASLQRNSCLVDGTVSTRPTLPHHCRGATAGDGPRKPGSDPFLRPPAARRWRFSPPCIPIDPRFRSEYGVPVNEDCRHYIMQTTRHEEKLERCRMGANEQL